MRTVLAVALFAAAATAGAQERRNWFDDPFLQVRHALPDCPLPRGPWLTEAEQRAEAHGRIERGTSCWMAGQCDRPNAYLYDAGIAEELRRRFAQSPDFRDASLWITVQRRFVWIQGCVGGAGEAAMLEALARGVPEVEHVFVDVMRGTSGKPPYPLRDGQ